MSNQNPEHEIVLGYGDAVLRRGDIITLENRETFLSDTVIEYAIERLEAEHVLPAKRSDVVIKLLRPSMAQLLARGSLDPASLSAILDISVLPAGSGKKQFIFIPVNNQTRNAIGGTHWSLLVYEEHAGSSLFKYFDSFGQMNLVSAKVAKAKLVYVLEASAPGLRTLSGIPFVSVPCQQQENGFDCGVLVIAFMRELVAGILDDKKGDLLWDLRPAGIKPERTVAELLESIQLALDGKDSSGLARVPNKRQ